MKKNYSYAQICFINKSVNRLPVPDKTILKLHFWGDYTLDEVAFIYDLPLSLVEKVYNRAIHKLRLDYLIEFSLPKCNRGLM
jgi:hypothetical protein